ncbi:flavodoxin [Butyrivibrio sp. FCS014]
MKRLFKTLLERYDFTGKNILPFCTNEGSGMGSI